MKSRLPIALFVVAGLLLLPACHSLPLVGGPHPSLVDGSATPGFKDFDRRARRGERLTVVFFGASLTWSANASDQQFTSYRAFVRDMLEEKYPKAHFRCIDGAIGGTNSFLGAFRLQRDCLAYQPDLVFLDSSANDGLSSDDVFIRAAYESHVRRIIRDANAPVVIVAFPFMWDVNRGNTAGMKGLEAHHAIGRAYNVPVGDAVVLCQKLVREKTATINELWPYDGVHPGDAGYKVFAQAAMQGFLDGVENERVCKAPEKMLNADTFMNWARVRVSSLDKLPPGWKVTAPNRTAAWYDAMMTRWLDDETVVSNKPEVKDNESKAVDPPSLTVKFNGEMVLLFGEKTEESCKYRILIDGKLPTREKDGKQVPIESFDANSKRFGGNVHLAEIVAHHLDPSVDHTLVIDPLFEDGKEQELRIESICVAGGKAKVWLDQEE